MCGSSAEEAVHSQGGAKCSNIRLREKESRAVFLKHLRVLVTYELLPVSAQQSGVSLPAAASHVTPGDINQNNTGVKSYTDRKMLLKHIRC